MSPRIGCLFSGYGGLSMAVQQVIPDAVHAWFCEFDDAPSKILAHHWPDVPNLHDITTVDWSTVPPVDILTGGFPCQDVSVAGRRAGMRPGTRSGLWAHMRYAIDQLRPSLVLIENVGGLFSATADSRVEPCQWGLGDADRGGHTVLLRAADAVLGDLATLGFDAEWVALRASDVGAPHGRLRVFVAAWPTGRPPADPSGGGGRGRGTVPGAGREGGPDTAPVGADDRPHAPGGTAGLSLLPTPVTERGGFNRSAPGQPARPKLDAIAQLLPTPGANLGTNGGPQDPAKRRAGGHSVSVEDAVHGLTDFGPYTPAIERWERVLGRPAPAPTEPGRTRPRLSAAFVEFLMGLPAGHVTGVPGITRNQQLKALGNGVVPLQGATALAHLLTNAEDHLKETP